MSPRGSTIDASVVEDGVRMGVIATSRRAKASAAAEAGLSVIIL